MTDTLHIRLIRHAEACETDGIGSLPTAGLIRDAASALKEAGDALELFIEAEHGNGWSDLKDDCIERIAYDQANRALAKLRGAP